MKTIELDILSKDELKSVKGGEWYYDTETEEWYWYEANDLGGPNFPGAF